MDLNATDKCDECCNVVIKIENLKVWTPEEKSWWRRKPVKPRELILDNVSGCILEGEFTAVIGPSGAGKTTFLVALAGKCTLPSEGAVKIKGKNVKELQGAVEIIPQFEVFVDSLTVMEHLVFMTELKLGNHKDNYNDEILKQLINELQLSLHTQTPIKALSGGERKLLSLASSLLSNPHILICDEPTSGLDSHNALLVVEILKQLSLSGKVVICSVHQPSADLFHEFNSILLMTDGKLLFHGSHDDCKKLFESVNLYCPKNYNPAEFYIRAVSNLNSGDRRVGQIMESYNGQSIGDETSLDRVVSNALPIMYRRSWFKQVQLLLWRSSLTLKRDIRKHLLQLFITVMVTSMVLGTSYVGISGTTQRGIQDIRGFLWLITSEVSFTISYTALYAFANELALFRREVGLYTCSAYYVSKFLCFVPRCLVWPIVLVSLTTSAVVIPNHAVTVLEFIIALIVMAFASTAYGLGMAALFTSTGVMGDVMPCADLPLFLMSGAFLRISSLPTWLYPIKYISHFYYGMDAVSNIYWKQIGSIDCPSNSTVPCVKDGAAVLIETGYSSNFVLQDSLGLIFLVVMWSVLGYAGLKREEKKGYAY